MGALSWGASTEGPEGLLGDVPRSGHSCAPFQPRALSCCGVSRPSRRARGCASTRRLLRPSPGDAASRPSLAGGLALRLAGRSGAW